MAVDQATLEREMRDLHSNGLKPRDIATALGIHEQQVRSVLGIPRAAPAITRPSMA